MTLSEAMVTAGWLAMWDPKEAETATYLLLGVPGLAPVL